MSGEPDETTKLRAELHYAVERKQLRERELFEHSNRIAVLKRKVAAKENEIRRLTDELRLVKRRQRSLLRSVSWKITIPLRVLGKMWKGLRSSSPNPTPETTSFLENFEEGNVQLLKIEGEDRDIGRDATAEVDEAVHPLFDVNWYMDMVAPNTTSPEQAWHHYQTVGWKKGLHPNNWFNGEAYLASHPKLKDGDINPLVHLSANPPIILPREDSLISWIESMRGGAIPSKTKQLKVVVYSALAGNYDHIHEPLVAPDDVDFVMFTDSPLPNDSIWKTREFDYFCSDPVRTARFIKTHPHFYFEDYDVAIWVDANLTLLSDPRQFLAGISDDELFLTWHHPLRSNVIEEIDECIFRKKDSTVLLQRIKEQYQKLNLNEIQGRLFETSVIVVRHQEAEVAKLLNAWWRGLDNGSKRDQLSLPLAAAENQVEIGYIARAGIDMRSDPRLRRNGHR